ncbi:putative membrane protein [Pectobacterium phage vB_PatM_CB7]|nr:putative membrane protein [Pectobacterium phage vB_PatM_CB7]
MRFLTALVVNAFIWIGLGKWGVEKLFPQPMASPFANEVPLVMFFGGVLTGLMIVLNLLIHTVGNE